jgi:hypothetical protein
MQIAVVDGNWPTAPGSSRRTGATIPLDLVSRAAFDCPRAGDRRTARAAVIEAVWCDLDGSNTWSPRGAVVGAGTEARRVTAPAAASSRLNSPRSACFLPRAGAATIAYR